MSWLVGQGQDNGDMIIVSMDDGFRDPSRRGGRDARVSVRFLGPHMLEAAENRAAFEDRFIPALEGHDGVFVAGITRDRPVSYTFIGYCSGDIRESAIPVEASLRSHCTVSVHHDPEWKEYEKWLPAPAKGLARVAMTVRSLLFRLLTRD
jgi:hypothetical protein